MNNRPINYASTLQFFSVILHYQIPLLNIDTPVASVKHLLNITVKISAKFVCMLGSIEHFETEL